MSGHNAAKWSSLTAALSGLFGGIVSNSDERLSAAFFAVGFLFLGIWLVLLIKEDQNGS